MLGGFGSIQGMIISLRNNKQLLRKKSMFKKDRSFLQKDELQYHAIDSGIKVEKISESELKKIRLKTLSENRKQNRRQFVFIISAFTIILLFLFVAFNNFNIGNTQVTSINYEESQEFRLLKEKYLFYLKDGDRWLKKHRYHNAIFQYRKAQEIFPNEFDAQYRLALGLCYQCQYKFKGCEEGNSLIDKLLLTYPNKTELDSIKKIFNHWGLQ